MAQITLSYNARNSFAQKTITYILSLGVFKKVDVKGIDIALEEVKKGKTKTYDSVDDFFKHINKEVF